MLPGTGHPQLSGKSVLVIHQAPCKKLLPCLVYLLGYLPPHLLIILISRLSLFLVSIYFISSLNLMRTGKHKRDSSFFDVMSDLVVGNEQNSRLLLRMKMFYSPEFPEQQLMAQFCPLLLPLMAPTLFFLQQHCSVSCAGDHTGHLFCNADKPSLHYFQGRERE